MNEVVLVRHGETEWSRSGQHTGTTDVPLTDPGRAAALRLADALSAWEFSLVLTSPLRRAFDTAVLAGYGDVAVVEPEVVEWRYGEHEGRTTPEIRETVPGWTVWTHPSPGGESGAEVGERVDRVIARVQGVDGPVLIVAHGHVLRVLAARWLGLAPTDGRLFALDPATISVLGWKREVPVLRRWNAPVVDVSG